MKNTLKALCTVALRIAALYRVRCLEIQIDGATEALACVRCPMTLARIEVARHNARISLAIARAEYNALLPVGQRRTWRMA